MEARIARVVSFSTLLVGFWLLPAGLPAQAAGYKTANFTVSAPTPQLAKEIGDQAEVYRRQLSIEWLGQELPGWSQPCPIHAQVAAGLGAGQTLTLILQGGGNNCTSAYDFTHWMLVMWGPKAKYHFFGSLQTTP